MKGGDGAGDGIIESLEARSAEKGLYANRPPNCKRYSATTPVTAGFQSISKRYIIFLCSIFNIARTRVTKGM